MPYCEQVTPNSSELQKLSISNIKQNQHLCRVSPLLVLLLDAVEYVTNDQDITNVLELMLPGSSS